MTSMMMDIDMGDDSTHPTVPPLSSTSPSPPSPPLSPSSPPSPFLRPLSSDHQSWSNVPYLYDFFYEFWMDWPFYTMAWGPILPSSYSHSALKNDFDREHYLMQRLYYAQATSSIIDKYGRYPKHPNVLIRAEMPLPKSLRTVDMSSGVSRDMNILEDLYCSYVTDKKKIIHPMGEINKIKVVSSSPEYVCTLSDSSYVFVWNMNTQPNRIIKNNLYPSVPDITLSGHDESNSSESNTYFALDCSLRESWVVSGGPDCKVCVWNIEDYVSAAVSSSGNGENNNNNNNNMSDESNYTNNNNNGINSSFIDSSSSSSSSSSHKKLKQDSSSSPSSSSSSPSVTRHVSSRHTYSGHTATVEDVAFHPTDYHSQCASTGDDRRLCIWDSRVDSRKGKGAIDIHTNHTDDVNALSWNPKFHHYIVTGSSDTTIKLIDIRKASSSSSSSSASSSSSSSPYVIHTFSGHTRDVKNVSWSPGGIHFASGGDDGNLNVWGIHLIDDIDLGKGGEGEKEKEEKKDRRELHHPEVKKASTSTSTSSSSSPSDSDPSLALPYSSPANDALISSLLSPTNLSLSRSLHNSVLSPTDHLPSTLLFRNTTHRTAVECIVWNPYHDPLFTMASIHHYNGGVIHFWRMNDQIWRPVEEVGREVEENLRKEKEREREKGKKEEGEKEKKDSAASNKR